MKNSNKNKKTNECRISSNEYSKLGEIPGLKGGETKMKNSKQITKKNAKDLVDKLGPSYGYDLTYDPVFPKTRKDVCAIRRLAENGSTYGYDTIYLLWNSGKEIEYEELMNSSDSKDYVSIESVVEKKEDIVVNIYSGSGEGWKRSIERNKKDLGLK